MQAAVWRLTAGGHSAAHDLCVSAPTGSGKTLAYALPIVSALMECASSPQLLPSPPSALALWLAVWVTKDGTLGFW